MRTNCPEQRAGSGYPSERSFFFFLLKALIWGAITFFIAHQFAITHYWFVILSIFLFSIPIILCGIYSSTVRQIRRLAIFSEKGWIYKLISGRFLKSILWILWALGTSLLMLIQFHIYSELEWFIFFMIVPAFWLIFKICHGLIKREIVPYFATEMALTWARRVCPLLMLAIYFISVPFITLPEYTSLSEAINTQKSKIADMTGSALVREASQFLAIYEGIKAYVFGHFGRQDTLWGWLMIGLGEFVIFFNACTILSCFLIPHTEYRRILGPLTESKTPSLLSVTRIATVTAIFTFIMFFIYLPIFVYIEASMRQTSNISHSRQAVENWTVQKVEQIDDAIYKKGTIAQIERVKFEALRHVEISQAHLQDQIDRAFDQLETKVDDYLDWYYSLVGEYTRIAKLLVGELEVYMIEKLEKALMQEDTFRELQIALDNLLSTHQEAEQTYQETVHMIMQANRIDPANTPIQVVQQLSSKDALASPIAQDVISLQYRVGGGALAGVITAAVTGKIIGKLAGKNILKLAANALIKIIISKTAGAAAGAGAGAATGAVIGSIVPGPGTVLGATLGGIMGGIGTGVAVDKMLIELEEAINREKFKGEILSVIQEVRQEFKAQYGIRDSK